MAKLAGLLWAKDAFRLQNGKDLYNYDNNFGMTEGQNFVVLM